MKRNLLLFIGIIALLFPMSLTAQEGPKISGFVQGLGQMNIKEGGDDAKNTIDNTFRARRVRMSVEGSLAKGLTYKIQGDFLNSPMLVDAFIKYKVCDAFAIQAGQFKTPFTMESPINPVNLEIFDYGESVQGLSGYSDVCGIGGLGRDLGIMFTGNLIKPESLGYSLLTYSLGMFNGNGPVNFKKNEKGLDNNNRKDIVGKLEVHPWLKDITLSGSYYLGWYDVPEKIHNGTRNRWAAGAKYDDGDIMVRTEYLSGATGYMSNTLDSIGNIIGSEQLIQNSQGFYAVAGYNFRLGRDKSQKLMPVLRYEHFAANADIDKGGTTYYTVGLNYWPLKSVNLKLDYSLIQPEAGNNTHRIVGMISYKF